MYRVGLGHDTHRLIDDRPLILGGVTIPHPKGPDAHSDGDVLLHALTDALLGAAGLGDIGEWFPDNDPAFAGADSTTFLTQALEEIASRGWQVVNVDCTVFAQQPRLSPHKNEIAARVAELLGIDRSAANVKAKTGERVGPIGREEAIAADAIVLLSRAESPVNSNTSG
ncbi:MAG: 2-C-methyl-D-erythritol 2,4-cyclodiphosphate synthase [Planctomycetota bacterium]|nr:MAG: 2-C-methyl-D-erythritol 2,4-cyclodiphosphate synthase [Planctomycetota bacterium]REJ94864.1 MAG: 2-C-methyl-D-erythritol 2,4-cyclodiphosphate synthase [Planctomycetota bacterium]REK30734.1 MAG: 2-C-methyl-D-erythritol 2,4-cyclodiphosphate synthase [Planctomycetota bacterium]REK33109.1 MAG: 2-C-methyl-D-erythritol 2,4-cyclodiphosphate synthase [Planctomycetota bacterium]